MRCGRWMLVSVEERKPAEAPTPRARDRCSARPRRPCVRAAGTACLLAPPPLVPQSLQTRAAAAVHGSSRAAATALIGEIRKRMGGARED